MPERKTKQLRLENSVCKYTLSPRLCFPTLVRPSGVLLSARFLASVGGGIKVEQKKASHLESCLVTTNEHSLNCVTHPGVGGRGTKK